MISTGQSATNFTKEKQLKQHADDSTARFTRSTIENARIDSAFHRSTCYTVSSRKNCQQTSAAVTTRPCSIMDHLRQDSTEHERLQQRRQSSYAKHRSVEAIIVFCNDDRCAESPVGWLEGRLDVTIYNKGYATHLKRYSNRNQNYVPCRRVESD